MLLVLEGIDGSGKTTLARRLAEVLRERGREVVETREPTTDSEAGRELREILSHRRPPTTPAHEAELFALDRAHHVETRVRPALARGAWVVQDRTFYSTAAYQGARGLDPHQIVRDHRRIAPEPDLVLLLQLEPREALRRVGRRGEGTSVFEREATLREVDRIYRELAGAQKHFVRLDATLDPDELLRIALTHPLLRTENPAS